MVCRPTGTLRREPPRSSSTRPTPAEPGSRRWHSTEGGGTGRRRWRRSNDAPAPTAARLACSHQNVETSTNRSPRVAPSDCCEQCSLILFAHQRVPGPRFDAEKGSCGFGSNLWLEIQGTISALEASTQRAPTREVDRETTRCSMARLAVRYSKHRTRSASLHWPGHRGLRDRELPRPAGGK